MQSAPRPWIPVLLCVLALASGCSEPAARPAPGEAAPAPGEVGPRVAEILALEAPLPRAAALAGLLSRLDPEALPAVLEAFHGASVDRGDTELVLFATWWAGFDPEAAHAWSRREWTAAHLSVTAAVFRTWAARDPQAAWNEAQSIPIAVQRDLATDAVIVGWYESGAPGLEQFIESLPAGQVRQQAADTLARVKVVDLGGEGAFEWAEGLARQDFRSVMSNRVASAVGWADPELAARWATPRIDDGHRTSGLARRVATRWVRSDPEAAMQWLSSLPDGGTRKDGVIEAYRDWLRLDQEGAVAWIEARELEPWLEPALSLYARGPLARRDPENALAAAARINDAILRDTTSTYIARDWLRRDEAAADAWLQQSDLPESVVRNSYAILRILERKKMREQHRAERARAAEKEAPVEELGAAGGTG